MIRKIGSGPPLENNRTRRKGISIIRARRIAHLRLFSDFSAGKRCVINTNYKSSCIDVTCVRFILLFISSCHPALAPFASSFCILKLLGKREESPRIDTLFFYLLCVGVNIKERERKREILFVGN